jgi:hypothetical protein
VESELAGLEGEDADRAAIEAGRIRIDAEAARSCAAQLRAAGCEPGDALFEDDAPCSRIGIGNVPLGSTCFDDDECSDGLCAFSDETDSEGTCTAAAEGDPCVNTCRTFSDGERDCSPECAGDLSCEADVCVLEEPDPGIGEPCEFFCDFGAWCNEDNICEAVRPAGAPCDDDEVCDSYECVNGQCAEIEYCF